MKSSKTQAKKTTSNSSDQKDLKPQQKEKDISNNAAPVCDICAQNVPGPEREKIFAVGKCDHHVCYVCSARLRAICDQLECPICREKLENVVFSSNKNKPYEKYSLKDFLYNEKFKIYFENESIREAFDRLLRFECLECKNGTGETKRFVKTRLEIKTPVRKSTSNEEFEAPKAEPCIGKTFPDVLGLKHHLTIVHKLKLCDLCLTHNKLFPFEFSYYDANSLRKHMREGEQNTPHRGHPNCSLCHNTFFNNDELLQHMSREHFHCHLCGRHDSNMLIYFLDYESLRQHFKSKHLLCERDHCRHEQFISAFDSHLDYQLHMVQVHGSSSANLSRGEARQQRTITLDAAPHRPAPVNRQENLPRNAAVVSMGNVATANSSRQQVPESIQAQIRQQRLPSRSDFPALGNMPQGFSQASLANQTTYAPPQDSSSNNYPSLPSASRSNQSARSSTLSQRLVAGTSGLGNSFVRSAGGGLRRPEQLNEMEFPPLPEQPKANGNNKPKNPKQKAAARCRDGGLTLDQLISSSLTLSAKNNNRKQNKHGKSNKSSKPKPLKIQL